MYICTHIYTYIYVRTSGSISGLGRSPFLPGESHGQRSLVGYSPRGCKESDMTELTKHANTCERGAGESGRGEATRVSWGLGPPWKARLGHLFMSLPIWWDGWGHLPSWDCPPFLGQSLKVLYPSGFIGQHVHLIHKVSQIRDVWICHLFSVFCDLKLLVFLIRLNAYIVPTTAYISL